MKKVDICLGKYLDCNRNALFITKGARYKSTLGLNSELNVLGVSVSYYTLHDYLETQKRICQRLVLHSVLWSVGSWSPNKGPPWQQTVSKTKGLNVPMELDHYDISLRHSQSMVWRSSNRMQLTQSFHRLKYIISGEKVPNFRYQHSVFLHLTTELGHIVWKVCTVAEWLLVRPLDGREYRFLTTAAGSTYAPVYLSVCVKTVPARNQTKPSHSKVGSNQGPRILYNVSYNCGLSCDEICSILISVGLRSNILGLVRRYFSCWNVVKNSLEITFQVSLWWCWCYGPY